MNILLPSIKQAIFLLLFTVSINIVTHSQADLIPDKDRLVQTLRTDLLETHDHCFIEEGCVTGLGDRQVLRFETLIRNIGNEDFYVGRPPEHPAHENETWEWDQCHNHWHYESYAQYLLFNQQGEATPIGYKTGFCLLDSRCASGILKYHCSNQGISAGCYDIYGYETNCQWIDVTEVPDGIYTLALRINWDRAPDANGNHELDYNNNEARVCFQLTRSTSGAHRIVLLDSANCQCPDADRDGICATDDCDDNNAAIPSSQACPTLEGESQVNGNETTNSGTNSTNTNVFDLFPWLSTIVNPTTCTNESIHVFNYTGGLHFIQVVGNNSKQLYFQDGTFYCDHQSGIDCLTAYNLSNPIYNWQCGQTQATPLENTVEETNQMFIDYPWLIDHYLATTCIKVYTYDNFRFIHLQESTESYGRLYLQNGVFYCMDQPNFDCRSNYGLDQSDLVGKWNCPSGLDKSEKEEDRSQKLTQLESSLQNKSPFRTTDFRVYPNPAIHQITLDFGTTVLAEDSEVQIINYTGQVVQHIKTTNQTKLLTIDLIDLPNGFYLVTLTTKDKQVVKKMLISK